MKRVFIDTNIVLDLLAKRIDFYEEAQDLFTYSQDSELILTVSTLTFANAHYILSDQLKMTKVRNVLRTFKILVEVLPFNDKILELALETEFKDFEDGIQYYTALEYDNDAIITRNKRDFKLSSIPILNAKEFLELVR